MPAVKKTKRSMGSLGLEPKAKRQALNQIRTAIGHAQGIDKMIEQERYCIDILKQIAAVQASLSKVAHFISESHMKHCVVGAIEHGQGESKVRELMETLKYLKHF